MSTDDGLGLYQFSRFGGLCWLGVVVFRAPVHSRLCQKWVTSVSVSLPLKYQRFIPF